MEQRDASEEQSQRHKQKWQLYESHGRHRQRKNPWLLGDASRSSAQIEEDARRWSSHLAAVAAGRPGEFTPAAASSTQMEADGEPPPPTPTLQPPCPDPQRPPDLPQIALLHCVGDRVEWYNSYHLNCDSSEPVFGWQPGTVVCTYNVCPLARADSEPDPYVGLELRAEINRKFHFDCPSALHFAKAIRCAPG